MALLQRLVADREIGFNYDQMGFAEFEFGATAKARGEIAMFAVDHKITARRVKFVGVWGVTKVKFDAVVIGEQETVDGLPDTLKLQMERGFMRNDDPTIVGWMTVGDTAKKVMIFRDDASLPQNLERVEKFLKPFVQQIEASRAAA